jgi:hypothetical protein
MISDDEYLERIVAGIQVVSTADAQVSWNEVINGRQFDVVVRFKLGTLRYLILIEVKNRIRKAQVEDIDAFVTKARDQNANKAVFVTAAGFQAGAIEVAKRHGIDLFTVSFDESKFRLQQNATFIKIRNLNAPKDAAPEYNIGEPEFVVAVEKLTLVYADGTRWNLPCEQSQMNYYCLQTKLSDGRTLQELINAIRLPKVQFNQTLEEETQFDPSVQITPPDTYFFPAGEISAAVLKMSGRKARPIRGNVKIDPSLFTAPVIYTDAITGEETRFALESLPLGQNRVSPGHFYFTIHPLTYFYCETIKGMLVHWVIVESFQAGNLIQAKITQQVKYSLYYLPVIDKNTIYRLQDRLKRFYCAAPKYSAPRRRE